MAVNGEERINSDGVTLVGEFVSRTMREALTADDYRNASIAGATAVLEEAIQFADSRISAAGPYDDVRVLHELKAWLADKIRAVHSGATNRID